MKFSDFSFRYAAAQLRSAFSVHGALTAFFALCLFAFVPSCIGFKPWGSKRKEGDLARLAAETPGSWAAAPKVTLKDSTGWLADFDSASLTRLVSQAMEKNRDLRVSSARMRQAIAQARVAGADLYPQISADFGARRSQSASGQRFVGTGQRSNRFEAGLDVSWELDLWGRLSDQRGAAAAEAEASGADLHAARLSLAANTVKAVFTLTEASQLIDLAQENVESRRVHLGIVEKQLDRGLDSERAALDVSLSRADFARAEATLASRKRDADAARRSLELLLGAYPAGLEAGLRKLPDLSQRVPSGLPSDLLLRRPDLQAAERRLQAALKTESAARKAFLPNISLTTGTGLSTQDLTFLLEKESVVWNIAGSVAQSIFQGGRVKGTAELARARYDEALETYAGTALQAFQEVETALAAEGYLREQAAALLRASQEADRSRNLALGQYDKGLTDILTLLDAQQRLFDARSAYLAVQALLLRNRADLHLALGGDF